MENSAYQLEQKISAPLLAWFDQNKRSLPFREDPSPYHIWVSEIMLQQTRVAAALPYYHRFVQELPTIQDLAACDDEKLHKLWEGLGYYSRVRNLRKAARIVVEQYGGNLPADYQQLKNLPGIGEYTAGAIASIAFGLCEIAVDGNVLRVFSRLTACQEDIFNQGVKKGLSAEVKRQQPQNRPGAYNEALMELGALVCTPKSPACGECPLQAFCNGFSLGIASSLPVKTPPKPKEQISVCVLVVKTPKGEVIVNRRPSKGLLAGLWQPVVFKGEYTREKAQKELDGLFSGAVLGKELPKANHVFTHKVWKMYGWECQMNADIPLEQLPLGYAAASQQQLKHEYAIPTAFKAFLPYMLGLH